MQEVFSKIINKLNERIEYHEKRRKLLMDAGLHKEADKITDRILELDFAKRAVEQEVAEYNNGWIPSSESLPCESGYYLVTYHEWSNGDYLPKYDDTYVRRLHYQRSEHFVGWNYPHCVDEMAEADTNREVIAWMNLPAPYQPKGE